MKLFETSDLCVKNSLQPDSTVSSKHIQSFKETDLQILELQMTSFATEIKHKLGKRKITFI